MKYNPPRIEHISQILPLLEGKDEFQIINKGAYTFIDYLYEKEDTFSDPLLLECRGIKFNSDGTILARPFHKFYNINQKAQYTDIDWSVPHVITEKLDGSMIHSAYIDGRLVLMTRSGMTDHSALAGFQALSLNHENLCKYCEDNGITPLFEFVSPKNRIVIKYNEPGLILLGARHKVTGVYLTRVELKQLSERFSVRIVHFSLIKIDSIDSASLYIDYIRKIEGMEGYVIQFETGFALKIKADDYVLKHKTKSYFDLEKGVLQITLEDKLDDLLPLLEKDDQLKAMLYALSVNNKILSIAEELITITRAGQELPRKEFALGLAKTIDKRFKAALFSNLDKQNQNIEFAIDLVKEVYMKWCSSQTKIDENRDLIGSNW